jgi:DNA-binding NarL/FixJ family response regulator
MLRHRNGSMSERLVHVRMPLWVLPCSETDARGGTAVIDSPRVLIADDHAPTRAGVRMALNQGGCVVCAEVDNAVDAVTAAVREQPDVCLIDLQMPGDGLRAVAGISSRLPNTRVLVLTVSPSAEDMFDALRAGAHGYLLKDMAATELPNVVRGTLAGEAPLPGNLTAWLIDEFRNRGQRRSLDLEGSKRVALTPREWDVLELLDEGLSTAEIARRLAVTQATVRRHVSTLLHKMGASTREQARRLLAQRRRSIN